MTVPAVNLARLLGNAEALIIDHDGTLADTTCLNFHVLHDTLAHHGLTLDEAWYRRNIGLAIRDMLALLPGAAHLPVDQIITANRARILTSLRTIRPIPATLALVRHAHAAGLPCAIATGNTATVVHPALRTMGVDGLFTAVVTVEDVVRRKPDPEVFLRAAERLHTPPERCLAIDDAPDGITAAQAAGMRVLTLADGDLVPAPTSEPAS